MRSECCTNYKVHENMKIEVAKEYIAHTYFLTFHSNDNEESS